MQSPDREAAETGTGTRDDSSALGYLGREDSYVLESHRVFACKRCTRRKQRCDKLLPVCTPCRVSNSPCTSSGKESHVVHGQHKAFTRKGLVTILLERISALENEAQKRGVSFQGGINAGPDAQSDRPRTNGSHAVGVNSDNTIDDGFALDGGFHSAVGQSSGRPSVAQARSVTPIIQSTHQPDSGLDVGVPGTSMDFLSLSAVAEPRNREGEFLKHLSTTSLIAGVTETYGGNPEMTDHVDSLWKSISQYIRQPAGAACRLHIPREQALMALSTYLDVVDFRLPRLPVTKVQSGMDAISSSDDRRYNETLKRDPAHIFMAYAVMAIAPLISENYPIARGSWVSVHLLGKCLKVLDLVFRQEDGVDVIQCLHLLVVLSVHCSAAGSAWHLVGFAMSRCIALGYHREDPRIVGSASESDIQQRRWAFWGCYHIERFICAALGRPFSINDEDITVPLPALERAKGDTSTTDRDSSPLVALQKEFHIHHFRYAIVLSLTAQNLPDSEPLGEESGFDYYLGHALHWRSNTPRHEDPSVDQAYLYHTSLFNTLLLRIAILEITGHYVYDERDLDSEQRNQKVSADVSAIRLRYVIRKHDGDVSHEDDPEDYVCTAARLRACEQMHIKHMNLFKICQAVARMFDRHRLVGRQYLSLITGYNCFSLALACLYYLVIERTGEAPTPVALQCLEPGEIRLDNTLSPSTMMGVHGSGSFPITSPPINNNAQGNQQQEQQQQSDMYQSPQSILDLACRKLEIVGRQFPRLHEYKALVENIRYVIETRRLQQGPGSRQSTNYNGMGDIGNLIQGIDPVHLRRLAEAIHYVLMLG